MGNSGSAEENLAGAYQPRWSFVGHVMDFASGDQRIPR